MDEVVDALRDVLSELQDLNYTLSQMSDGLFELNLHVGADVSAWTGGRSTLNASPPLASNRVHSQGVVKWYDPEKGFGFITQTGGGADVFVHHSVVPAPGYLRDGQHVDFEMANGKHGLLAVSLQFG